MTHEQHGAQFRYVPASVKALAKGRVIALSDFDFDAYDYHLKIDRVELYCELEGGKGGRPGTQFSPLRRLVAEVVGKNAWVEPVGSTAAAQRSCTSFTIKFQDPTIDELLAIQGRLDADYGLRSYPTLGSIEIALDLAPKAGRDRVDALRRATVMLRQHLLPRIEWRAECDQQIPRVSNGERTLRMHMSTESVGTISAEQHVNNWTYYVGAQDVDTAIYKIYWKQSDNVRPGQARTEMTKLPIEEQVARAEVTLGPSAIQEVVGGNTIPALAASGMEGIRKYFQFATPILPGWEHRTGLRRAVCQRYAKFVLDQYVTKGSWWFAATRSQHGRAPLKGGTLVVHEELSNKTRNAHRRLQTKLTTKATDLAVG